MNIDIHPAMLKAQRYSCSCCAKCCAGYMLPVRGAERKSIDRLRDWRKKLGADEIFLERGGECVLAKRENGRCVFLDDADRCILHASHGAGSKPLGCRLFPFVLTPYGDRMRVGLRFDCPSVCRGEGRQLTHYSVELAGLAGELGAETGLLPEPTGGLEGSREVCGAMNEAMIRIIGDRDLPILLRLHRMREFLDRAEKVKWKILPENAICEVLEEMCRQLPIDAGELASERGAPSRRTRKLLGQIFFLLCHPPTLITAKPRGRLARMRERFGSLGASRRLGRASGPLPPLLPWWPQCDMADLERSFGPWPAKVDQLVSRYLLCRLASMGYCGRGFYNYTMIQGARTLLLAAVTLGWLMRVQAIGEGRKRIKSADCEKAVIAIDGNLGYAPALGTGPSLLRLRYLNEGLGQLLDWYCS